jgi:hypothetical protein
MQTRRPDQGLGAADQEVIVIQTTMANENLLRIFGPLLRSLPESIVNIV